MKFSIIIFAALVSAFFSLDCGAQFPDQSTMPATRGKTGETTMPARSPQSTGSRVVASSSGRVINTRTLTITGATTGGAFSPVTIDTKALTITGATADGTFSPVTINTQTLTITGSSGGK